MGAPPQSRGQVSTGVVRSRFHVLSWGEGREGAGRLEALWSLRGCLWGPGTCTEGPSRDERRTDVADGVVCPACVEDSLFPGPPGHAKDRAFMRRVSAILPGYPAVGHIQACLPVDHVKDILQHLLPQRSQSSQSCEAMTAILDEGETQRPSK